MARAKPDPTPAQAFLAPLASLAAKHPAIEALVFWHGPQGWPADPAEELEAEEIAFYAEGLLDEGFRLHWRVLAHAAAPDRPEHIRLYLWEDEAPPPPDVGTPWQVTARGQWAGAPQ